MSERRPKLIATDLDGTIVPHDEGISHRTIAAFTKARDLGVEVFFVTGRPPRWMGDIKEAFDFGTAICCFEKFFNLPPIVWRQEWHDAE